ncbi:hypothetical protein CQW23_02908 [Capsicum baccatum]|uniref:Uncharacterized protein n=1 Tax=Capsicum baccatum TaxID=33114 RepID=A0A2G2XSS6_CAPBA|nr:hypothetical protein CQW23_02908 [Capsicum baccatum]
MSIAEFVQVSGDFMGEWVKSPKYWKWRSFTKVKIPIPVCHNSFYVEFVASVMQSGDLDCTLSDVVIGYLMHSREKVNPTIINSDVRMLTYIMDADTDEFRPILRINMVERSFEGLLNSLAPLLQRPAVDDNLNDYKNGELKSNYLKAAHVLENMLGFEKWSRVHFSGNKYDVMTTNIIESLHSILMDEQEYPVLYIFNSIARKFGEKFREHHAFVDGKENIFVPYAKRILRDNKSTSDSLYVTLRAKYGDGEGYGNSIYDYSSPIYKAESYLLVYLEAINVVSPKAKWTVPQKLLDTKISPPPTISNSEGRNSNELRSSVRHSSTKGGIGVQFAKNLGTKEPHVEWPSNHR